MGGAVAKFLLGVGAIEMERVVVSFLDEASLNDVFEGLVGMLELLVEEVFEHRDL